MKNNNKKSRFIPSRPVIIVFFVVFVGIVGLLSWRYFHHTTTVIPSTNPAAKQTTSNQSNTKTPVADTSNPAASTSDKTGSQTSGSTTLTAPSGTFVSNHHPNISGNPAPSSEASVCNTTPGASCVITLTKDNQTKTLLPQTTDTNGNAYWNWDVNTAGLTAGSWKISATATLNGKSLTTVDTLTLDIAP